MKLFICLVAFLQLYLLHVSHGKPTALETLCINDTYCKDGEVCKFKTLKDGTEVGHCVPASKPDTTPEPIPTTSPIDTTPNDSCDSDEDCNHIADGKCTDGKCHEPEPQPDECKFDKDCNEGEFCEWDVIKNIGYCAPLSSKPDTTPEPKQTTSTSVTKPQESCERPEDCKDFPEGTICMLGKCQVPVMPSGKCYKDEDCNEGEFCKPQEGILKIGVCAPKQPDSTPEPIQTPSTTKTTLPDQSTQPTPPEGSCISDEDCKDGEVCKEIMKTTFRYCVSLSTQPDSTPEPIQTPSTTESTLPDQSTQPTPSDGSCISDDDCKDGEICDIMKQIRGHCVSSSTQPDSTPEPIQTPSTTETTLPDQSTPPNPPEGSCNVNEDCKHMGDNTVCLTGQCAEPRFKPPILVGTCRDSDNCIDQAFCGLFGHCYVMTPEWEKKYNDTLNDKDAVPDECKRDYECGNKAFCTQVNLCFSLETDLGVLPKETDPNAKSRTQNGLPIQTIGAIV